MYYIADLDKAEVLISLYNRARCQGMGLFSHDPDFELTYDKANRLLEKTKEFEYFNGKVLKVDLSEDNLDTSLYNRDNGREAAETAIDALRQEKTNQMDQANQPT